MYPTPQEEAIIHEAEKIMIETMARYDPSHDQYHGESGTWPQPSRGGRSNSVCAERVSIQFSASAEQP